MAQVAAFALIIVVAPVALVWLSPRVQGHRKVRWMLIASLLSWIGYLAFLVLTRAGGDKPASRSA